MKGLNPHQRSAEIWIKCYAGPSFSGESPRLQQPRGINISSPTNKRKTPSWSHRHQTSMQLITTHQLSTLTAARLWIIQIKRLLMWSFCRTTSFSKKKKKGIWPSSLFFSFLRLFLFSSTTTYMVSVTQVSVAFPSGGLNMRRVGRDSRLLVTATSTPHS